MIQSAIAFTKNEYGAVTVDWVVLTAAIVLITIAAFLGIQSGSNAMGDKVGTFLLETSGEDLRSGL
jgi:Flp pilus assembly pilin Flp